ncbi:hypothetical protein RHGRI_028655 [Rhododendron griersonianum]|uniref:Uncharacterized protein n=1 Tax=Rhododendron griersonianum TaxID=479676 RepID=A0AAV6IGN5_9ERIC|nr:hypothetical protein RHGRI_028655 [Rhododendron griersonianum]
MNWRVKPLFGMLLLVVVAVTLSCRVTFRSGFIPFQLQNDGGASGKMSAAELNETLLLKYAAVDLAEEQWKQEIEQQMAGNFYNPGRKRTFLSPGRYVVRDVRSKSYRVIPVNIQSPEFYQLWMGFRKNLHGWWQNMRFEPDIMSGLVNLVKVPIDRNDSQASTERRYSSCAVVGSSGILLQSGNGELIDSHEMVIQLNNARTGGVERHVGSKTTLSFLNSHILHSCAAKEGCSCHPYGENVPIVEYICQPIHFLDYTQCKSSHKTPLVVTDARFDLLCARIVKYYSLKRFAEEEEAAKAKSLDQWLADWRSAHDSYYFHYSSGMQAVMLAVGICDKVISIFGFGKSKSAKHHYDTNQKAELRCHDYEAEYDLYHDLVDRPEVIPFVSDKFKFPPVVIYQ